jgi:hypothetical protein
MGVEPREAALGCARSRSRAGAPWYNPIPMSSNADNRHTRLAAAILAVFTVFCLWFSTKHELVQDEAYYWQWSRHLAVGYYDGPPAVAYVIRLGTSIFGSTELGVRSGAVICAAIAAWFLYLLATELFGGNVGILALTAALINPLFGAGATLMTLDPVQLCFWSPCAWVTWRALKSQPDSPQSWRLWAMSGLLAGFAALSKFNGLLILPSVLLFAIIEPTARIWLRKPHPYLAALIALIVFAPFVWWNHAHGNAFWIHINAMGSRTIGDQPRLTLKYLGDFMGAQAGLISPLLFLTYLWMMISAVRRQDASPSVRYCWCLSAVVFVATVLLSLKSRVEANWAVAAYLTGFILAAYAVVESWKKSMAGRIWHSISLALAAVLTLSIYISTLTAAGPRITFLDKRTDELYGWRAMAQRVHLEQAKMGADPFVFGINYRMPSELAFYLPGQPDTYSLFLHDRANEYMFWDDEPALIGRDAVMVNDSDTPAHLADAKAVFDRVYVEPPLRIYRSTDALPIRTIQIFRCYGFKGCKREDWQIGW